MSDLELRSLGTSICFRQIDFRKYISKSSFHALEGFLMNTHSSTSLIIKTIIYKQRLTCRAFSWNPAGIFFYLLFSWLEMEIKAMKITRQALASYTHRFVLFTIYSPLNPQLRIAEHEYNVNMIFVSNGANYSRPKQKVFTSGFSVSLRWIRSHSGRSALMTRVRVRPSETALVSVTPSLPMLTSAPRREWQWSGGPTICAVSPTSWSRTDGEPLTVVS